MYKSFAWDQFVKTGNLETYMEFKKIEYLDKMLGKEGDKSEANKSQGNSNTRGNI